MDREMGGPDWSTSLDYDERKFYLDGESRNETPIRFCPWCGRELKILD